MAKQKREVRHCQRCGEMNKPTDDKCVSCGKDITDDPQFMFGGGSSRYDIDYSHSCPVPNDLSPGDKWTCEGCGQEWVVDMQGVWRV